MSEFNESIKGCTPLETTDTHPSISRSIKPSRLKNLSGKFLYFVPVIFYVLVSAITIYQISLTSPQVMSELEGIKGVFHTVFTTSCYLRPISEIAIVEVGNNCPTGMEIAEIGSWPGSDIGCYDKWNAEVVRGACSAVNDRYFTVRASKPQKYTLWKGRILCVRRISNYTRQESAICQVDQHACRANPGYYCLTKHEPCPISSIEKINRIPPQRDPDSHYLELGNSIYFKFSNDPNSTTILTDLTASLTGAPCLDPKQAPYRISRKGYPFMHVSSKGCGVYGFDADSRVIDKIKELKFYEENGIRVFDFLPDFTIPELGDEIALIAKYENVKIRNFGCNMCSSKFMWRLQEGDDEITAVLAQYRLYTKVGIFLVAVLIFVLIYNVVIFKKHGDNMEIMNEKVGLINYAALGVLLGYYVIYGFFAIRSYSDLKTAAVATEQLVDLQCFQNNMINKVFSDFSRLFLTTNLKMVIDGILLILISIASIVLFIIAKRILTTISSQKSGEYIGTELI